jgi:uncharacterized membrane protein YdbT with pleckstrin-like domain
VAAAAEGLVAGEELVMRLHPHGKTLVRPAFLLLIVVAAALVVIFVLPDSVAHLGLVRAVVGVLALAAAIAWFGIPFLKWRTTIYELTNRRLRLRQGILSRTGRDIPLNRISDVKFEQGLIDRIFGCGRLIVESPGEQGELVLTEIPDVRQVQGVLFQLAGEEAARYGQLRPDSGGPDWPDRYGQY